MTSLKRLLPLVGTAFVLSLGLAACGEGTAPEQQSQAPAAEQTGDAAATSVPTSSDSESPTGQ